MSITATIPDINQKIVFNNEKESSEAEQVDLICEEEKPKKPELNKPSKTANIIKNSQYIITTGSILLHGSSVASIIAKKIEEFTGNNIFGLAKLEKTLTEKATWFCRYIDSLPTILSGLENMLEDKTFSLGIARVSTAMQMLFPNIANKTFGGGIANAHNSQKFLNDRAVKAGFVDKLVEAKEDTKAGHFSAFIQNSLNVSKASLKNLLKGEQIYHSLANLSITPLALLTFGIGVPFCRDDKLKIVPKKILRTMKGLGMILFNTLMIKLGKESKSEDIDIKATNKADSNLAKLGVLEAAIGALTGWVEDNEFLLNLKTHFCYTLKPLVNLGWNNRETLIKMIKKKLETNPNQA